MMLSLRLLLLAACTEHPQPLLLQQQLLHPFPRAALAGAPPPLSCCRCPPLPSARSACSSSWPTWLMPLMPPPAAEGGGISLSGSGKCSLVGDGNMLLSPDLTCSYHPAAAHSAALGDQGQHGRAGGRSARCVRALVTRAHPPSSLLVLLLLTEAGWALCVALICVCCRRPAISRQSEAAVWRHSSLLCVRMYACTSPIPCLLCLLPRCCLHARVWSAHALHIVFARLSTSSCSNCLLQARAWWASSPSCALAQTRLCTSRAQQ